jgi:tetratricopeptide (TPR) repeat protein
MMSVLLGNVAMWRGQVHQSVKHAREAVELFQDMGDRWGEVMATGSLVRGLAELGRDAEYADALANYRTVSRTMPDEGMRSFPEIVESSVDLQQGRPETAHEILTNLGIDGDEEGQLGFADGRAAIGLALTQLGQVDDAIDLLSRAYSTASDDGPAMSLGCRLALAYAAGRRTDDALRVIEELRPRAGGTFSDRILVLWAESLARTQAHLPDARDPIDAAYDIAMATDAPLEHAIAALARAKVLVALDTDDAVLAQDEAARELEALGLTADGWCRVFDLALAELSVSS